jgi:hypothetical protein
MTREIFPDVSYGNGLTPMCRSRCDGTLRQMDICHTIVPNFKACKHISENDLQNPVNRVELIQVHRQRDGDKNTIGTPAYF